MNEPQLRMYRLYFLDKLQRVQEWQAVSCLSDEAALAEAQSLIEEHIAVEVVEGTRTVGTVLLANLGRVSDGNRTPGLCADDSQSRS